MSKNNEIFDIFDIFNIFDIMANGYGSGASADICITTIGTLGDKNGYIKNSIGEISPNGIYAGLEVFEFTWDDIVTGEFILSFGDAGDDEVENVMQLSIQHPSRPDRNTAFWDENKTAYVFTDLDLAQWIGTDETRGCFIIEPQFELVVRYNYAEMLVGTGV